jgi:hypothetical protein
MPELLDQPPATPRPKRGFFTTENAADYARKSHAPDSARNQKPIAEPLQALAVQSAEPSIVFAERRLSRVRAQLDGLDALIVKESDPKRLKCLCDASARLSTQEFALAGRPLPGSRRPKEGREPRSAGWIELQPALPGLPSPVPNQSSAAPSRPLGWEYDDPNAAPREPDKLPGDVTP